MWHPLLCNLPCPATPAHQCQIKRLLVRALTIDTSSTFYSYQVRAGPGPGPSSLRKRKKAKLLFLQEVGRQGKLLAFTDETRSSKLKERKGENFKVNGYFPNCPFTRMEVSKAYSSLLALYQFLRSISVILDDGVQSE